MDDDDEDFEQLFFEECHELLGTLQEHLNNLADGETDEDTVHAAFRAVHSVKGGASAFGFDQLINFAHIFETVMDLVRSDKLEATDDICQTLLRSGDMMEVLVEGAQNGNKIDDSRIASLRSELEELAGAPPAEGAKEPAAQADVELFDDASETETASLDAGETDDTPSDGGAAPEDEIRTYVISFAPDGDFLSSGHDPLRLIRKAKDLGLSKVQVLGEVPSLVEFDPTVCSLSWELTFETDSPLSELESFFDIYSHSAAIDILSGDEPEEDDGEEDQPATEVSKTAPPQAEAGGGDDGGKPPANVEKPVSGAGRSAGATKSLRVELSRIDRLVNLVGEMLITQAGLAQRLTETEEQDRDEGHVEMGHSVDAMSRQLRELQESVMAIRAQPVKSVFSRMPRVVRDLADSLEKDAKLELFGQHTEVDATVIEELAEPLTHMLRNSMDHGLESNKEREEIGKPRVGQIKLSAEHRGERVIIIVEDDGRGVNREKVLQKAQERGLVSAEDNLSPEEVDQLIFHPGFSTADEVSSVSGRGVGMDVVKKKIVSLGGRCMLESIPGKGCRFEITLPLTLAVMDGMTIVVGGQKFILPLSSVVEALNVASADRKELPNGSAVLERRGEYLRLIDLRSTLGLPHEQTGEEMAIVVDTETNGLVALVVDELIGQRQIVLKSLEANFKRVDGISGATILGDGQVALILDVPELLHITHSPSPVQEMIH